MSGSDHMAVDASYGAGPLPPTMVQVFSGAGSGRVTSFSATWPIPCAAGNVLFIEAITETANAAPSTPAGWNLWTTAAAGTGFRHHIFWKTAAGGETSQTITMGNNTYAWITREISGWDAGAEVSAAYVITGSGNTGDPPSLALSAATSYLVVSGAGYAGSSPNFVSYSSGYGIGQANVKSTTSNIMSVASAAKEVIASASEDPGVIAWSATAPSAAYAYAIGKN